MSDTELDGPVDEEALAETSYQACYIFRSSGTKRNDSIRGPPSKKRRVDERVNSSTNFPRLSEADDTDALAERRWALFDKFWQSQQLKFDSHGVDEDSLAVLSNYLTSTASTTSNDRLPTALLLTGLDGNAQSAVVEKLAATLESLGSQRALSANLHNRQCPNLQIALKNLIKSSILAHSGLDGYNEFLTKHKRLMPSNFDLELLGQFVRNHAVSRIVVSLSDVETFDVRVLNDLVNTMHLWRQRIPFSLILSITSTRQLFEQRLSKSCLSHLQGREFDFRPKFDIFSQNLKRVQSFGEDDPQIFLGPSIVSALNETAQRQGNTGHVLKEILHHTYMSHALTNPLSVLADPKADFSNKPDCTSLAHAVRGTDSFRKYCQTLLSTRDKASLANVRRLLDDDHALLAQALKKVREGQAAYRFAVLVLHSFAELCGALARANGSRKRPQSGIEAMLYQTLDNLADNDIYDEAIKDIQSLPQSSLVHILRGLDTGTIVCLGLEQVLANLQTQLNTPTLAMSSTPASAPSTPKKRGKATAAAVSHGSSNSGSASTAIVEALSQSLRAASLDVSGLFLHEAYILSTRTTRFRSSFEPQPRAAAERALMRPTDYLGWYSSPAEADEHSERNGDETSSSERPAAALLFTLLQEAPTIINIRDLFDAFVSRLGHGKDIDGVEQNENPSDRSTMAIFYRALAELKMMGLVKSSTGTQIKRGARGKNAKSGTQDIDYGAKTSWAGL